MRAARSCAAALALLVGVTACDSGPKAGTVSVSVDGPPGLRSAELRLVGPVMSIQAGVSSVRLFTTQLPGDTLAIVAVATQGNTLNGQLLVGLDVVDVDDARRYATQIVEVAGTSYALLNPAQYTMSIRR